MFLMLSTMGAKLCLLLLTRDFKTAPYQLLLEEKMVPNAGKHFGSNFLFVHNNFLAHRAWKFQYFLKNQEIKVLTWQAYLPYLNSIKHFWDMLDETVNIREVKPTSLKELKVALSNEWENLSQRSNNKLVKDMPR